MVGGQPFGQPGVHGLDLFDGPQLGEQVAIVIDQSTCVRRAHQVRDDATASYQRHVGEIAGGVVREGLFNAVAVEAEDGRRQRLAVAFVAHRAAAAEGLHEGASEGGKRRGA